MKLNLGCGPHVMDSWVNIDSDHPVLMQNQNIVKDGHRILHDLSKGLPDRVLSWEVDYIFSEHFLEHITKPQAIKLLRDCFAAIRPGGVMRISTPDLRHLVSRYSKNELWAIPNVWEPNNLCDMMNEGMREWGHQYLWDEEELSRVLTLIGFKYDGRKPWRHSMHAALRGLEVRPFNNDLIVEATKP